MQAVRRVKWMRVLLGVVLLALLFFFFNLKKSPSKTNVQENIKQKQLSQYLGYTFWQDIKYYKDHYNFEDVILEDVVLGMKACEKGETLALNMTIQEERQMASDLQKELYEKICAKNLLRAQEFLAKIAQKPSIFVVVDQQLYYEVLREGKGEFQVAPTSTCLFHYTIKTLDDSEIADTRQSAEPKRICLADVIPGLAQGLIGMREGERRKIYIHPDLGYRKVDWTVPPESLLLIDIELCEGEKKS